MFLQILQRHGHDSEGSCKNKSAQEMHNYQFAYITIN